MRLSLRPGIYPQGPALFVLACVLAMTASLLTVGVRETADEWFSAAAITIGGLAALALFVAGGSSPWARWAAPVLLLALAIFATDSTFRFRAYTDKSIDTQIVLKVVLWCAGVGYAAVHLIRERRLPMRSTGWWWLAFFLWNVITGLEAPNPLFSIVAAASLVAFFIFELAVIDHRGESALALAILFGTGAICVGSLIAYYFVPDLGHVWLWEGNHYLRADRLRGITSSANVIGADAATGLLLLILYWDRLSSRHWPRLAALLVFAWALWLSNNRWATASVVVLSFAFHYLSLRRPALWVGVACLAILTVLIGLPFTQEILAALARSGNPDEIFTATNRTAIWTVAIDLWAQRPVFGWGYGSGLFILPAQAGLFASAAGTHNIFLEVLFGGGLVGLGLFLTALISSFAGAARASDRVALTGLTFLVLHGLTEAQPFTGVAGCPLYLLLLVVLRGTRESRAEPHGDARLTSPAKSGGAF